ncbi:MAG: retropepsin-like aspartic protease [Bacteroidales bacterium]
MQPSIPFSIVEIEPKSYHILVNARIGDTPVKFIVDTGASRSVFDREFDSGIRIDGIDDSVAVGFMSDHVSIELALMPEFSIEGERFDSFPVALADLSSLREFYANVTGLNIAGLLGCDFLVNNVTRINMRTRKFFLKKRV